MDLNIQGRNIEITRSMREHVATPHPPWLLGMRPLTMTMMIISTMSKTLTLIRPPRLIFPLNNSSTFKLFLWRASTFHIFCLFHKKLPKTDQSGSW